MDAATLKLAAWTASEVGGFTGRVGPFWSRGHGPEREIGLLVEPHHSSAHTGTIHGGAVMTFADIALGSGVDVAVGGRPCVTVQLNIQLVSAARIGDFITCRPELVRQSKRLAFVRGLVLAGDETIASADGVWKVIEER